MESLSLGQARRVALAAQGFLDAPHATPTLRTLRRTVARTGVLQVDSVNVLQRAHYMPLYSRMGPYDTELLRKASEHRARQPRQLIEYWAHVQALMPVDLWPFMQHRMASYRARRGKWWPITDTQPGLEHEVLAAVRDRGPVTARQLDAEFSSEPRDRKHWGWNWSESRKVLDYLYMVGDVAVAGRNSQFEVVYDVPERVLPAEVLNAPTPTPQDAAVELVRRAAVSHGVATGRCLADYYRMPMGASTRDNAGMAAGPAIERLVEDGELLPVRVDGWTRPAYLHRDARLPRRVRARTLLSPFDPVVWERERTEKLFDFHYRIEIYVPAAKRLHGYYVLPFLSGDRLAGRVDLKADRATGRLLVKAAYAEETAAPDTDAELAAELHRLAGWLGLDEIVVEPRGDLAAGVAAALATVSREH
ncbi:winged helix-turn-helix domain-containing protein [Nocardioides sp. Soil796]|uniref:winged helix-turn-helix domain-containing protein n=1 Tax=Nocardioides sp. Soil796 TaxID=1736412 RepID=UPI00070FE09D|nr:crosslink repair DNA glycosylase YcaQ family protein [Nocardioides sp. Soil796]KRF10579.1 cytoplasmic protein [Nocardioides sp. Soil796]